MAKKIISIRIDPKLEKQLRKKADEQERTASWLIESFIKRGLESLERETAKAT